MNHFLHSNHKIVWDDNSHVYTCDACILPGVGGRYRCSKCDFDIDRQCALATPQVYSFRHPQHYMMLLLCPTRLSWGPGRRFCGGCGQAVEGMFYNCGPCNFNLHPGCIGNQVALPQVVVQNSQAAQYNPNDRNRSRGVGKILGNFAFSVGAQLVATAIGVEIIDLLEN